MTARSLGFALRDPHPWRDLSGLVHSGEALGYEAVFLPEVGARDTLAALTGLAVGTERLVLGTGVVPIASRSPRLLAMAAATAHQVRGGRLILGLGTGPAKPGALDRLRGTVRALRSAFATGRSEVMGERFQIDLLPTTPPPIWIAALGPRAARLAGEVADGVLLNWCTPERVRRAVIDVAEGAGEAGRNPASIRIGVYIRACVSDTVEEALKAVRSAAAEYATYPAYARQFAAIGLEKEARTAAVAGRPEDVPERLVREVALVGTAEEARERLERYREAGADLPVVYPVPVAGSDVAGSVLATLEALAPAA